MPSDSPGRGMSMPAGGNDPANHWVQSWHFDPAFFFLVCQMGDMNLELVFRNRLGHRRE